MTEFVYQSKFQNVDYDKACLALRRNRQHSGKIWSGWVGLMVAALAIGGLAGFVLWFIGGIQGTFLAFVISIIGLFRLLIFKTRMAQKALSDAPLRSGVTQIRLTSEGYYSEHPGHEGITRWSHIAGVLNTPQALLILHSDYEFYPIETAAFRDEKEMNETADQIRNWIAMARGSENGS